MAKQFRRKQGGEKEKYQGGRRKEDGGRSMKRWIAGVEFVGESRRAEEDGGEGNRLFSSMQLSRERLICFFFNFYLLCTFSFFNILLLYRFN